MKIKISYRIKTVLVSALTILLLFTQANAFDLVKDNAIAKVCVSDDAPECLKMAVRDLVSDIKKITGKEIRVSHEKAENTPNLIIGIAGNYPLNQKEFKTFSGKWECYAIKTAGNDLIISGSDERGAMFGIYDFIENYLGVDPLYFWSGLEPEKKAELSWKDIDVTVYEPTFKYRGWFINDEDLLTEWKDGGGQRNIDYPYYQQVVSPQVMEHVVEAMVRSRFNMIIPASFLDIGNPAEEELVKVAAKRGVFISQHHIEPLGVNAFTYFNYWKAKNNSKPLFSYYSNKAELMEVWRAYAEKWAKYPNVIWQLGLRGIGDRPMWMADLSIPQTDADRGQIITDALKSQLEIIRSVDKRENPPMTMTLWAEGSYLFHEGYLEIPEQSMIIFSDNSPGWNFQDDFYSIERDTDRKYGVYYHHQLWGSGPHLAQAVPPFQTYKVMKEAVQRNSTGYAIMNVSNIREFLPGIAAGSQMLFDFQKFKPDEFLSSWCEDRFPSVPEKVKELYDSYFAGFVLHDEQKVPMLLDGQTNGPSNKILKEIEQKYLFPEKKTGEVANVADPKRELEKSWGAKSLADMHPQAKSTEEWLEKAREQRIKFSSVISEIEKIENQLTDRERTLLESNLLSHSFFMRGLSARLENVALAELAVDKGNRQECIKYLETALDYFEDIHKAKFLGSQGKWADWYRGDKKMNLARTEKLLETTIQKLKSN